MENKINIKRVVVLGSKGFIGNSITKLLKNNNIPTIGLSRSEVDLNLTNASDKLIELLNSDDYLVIASANAPVKNNQMLIDNIQMINNIIKAVSILSIKRVLYVSSDAVYSDSKNPITEESNTEPKNLHGIMHLTREIMLMQIPNLNLSILRPTLIYGLEDPHNGYGPNKFFKLANENNEISIFGKGEELRDHVCINDVATTMLNMILSNNTGILNIASGEVVTFKYIATLIKKFYKDKIAIKEIQRLGDIPHGGYRSFNIEKLHKLYPKIIPKKIKEGLKTYFTLLKN